MNFDNFKSKISNDNSKFLNKCLSDLENEFKQFDIVNFKKGTSNYTQTEFIIKMTNEHFLNIVEKYHSWLFDNFDIKSK